MCSYEEQLALLKKNLNKLQDYFGECGNVDELLEMVCSFNLQELVTQEYMEPA